MAVLAGRWLLSVGPLRRLYPVGLRRVRGCRFAGSRRVVSNIADKHRQGAIFSPAEIVACLTADSMVLAPDALIPAYQQFLVDRMAFKREGWHSG